MVLNWFTTKDGFKLVQNKRHFKSGSEQKTVLNWFRKRWFKSGSEQKAVLKWFRTKVVLKWFRTKGKK